MSAPDAAGALARLTDAAMLVVTAGDEARPAGCLVGFHTQASIEPWHHLAFLSRANHTHRVAQASTHLAVHVLRASDLALAELFGGETDDDDAHKFERCAWSPSPLGPPILDAALAWFVGAVVDRFDAGDHEGLLLAPVIWHADATEHEQVLHYEDVRQLDPGHPA